MVYRSGLNHNQGLYSKNKAIMLESQKKLEMNQTAAADLGLSGQL